MNRLTTTLCAIALSVCAGLASAQPLAGSMDPAAQVLPPDFRGITAQELLAASRHAPKAANETDVEFAARVTVADDEMPVLIPLDSGQAPCRASTSYDRSGQQWVVTLTSTAGVFSFECLDRMVGVSVVGPEVVNIVRIPMKAADADAVRNNQRLWLAVQRGAAPGIGRIIYPFNNPAQAAVAAKHLSVWMTDTRNNRVVAKTVLATRSEVVRPTLTAEQKAVLATEPALQTDAAQALGEPKRPIPWAEACRRPNRTEIIRGQLEPTTLKDLGFQIAGLQANGQELGTTLDQYVARSIDRNCDGGSGWLFELMPKTVIKVPGRIGCRSAGSGEGHKDECDFRTSIPAPPGWQICKLTYEENRRRHGRHTSKTTRFPEDPPNGRVLSVDFHFTGRGDVNNESRSLLENIHLTIISEEHATVTERRRQGCDYLVADQPTPRPQPTEPTQPTPRPGSTPTAKPANIHAQLINPAGDGITLMLHNSGGVEGTKCATVTVTRADGRPEQMFSGCVPVGPGATFTHGLHRWGNKRDWKLTIW